MLRVRRRALPAASLAACLLAVASIALAPGVAPASPATRTVKVSPTTSAGALRPGYTVMHTRRGASCEAGSDVISGVYRCFAGNSVLDPCWADAAAGATQVVCLLEPWSHTLTRLYLASAPESSPAGPLYVWGLQLATGQRCLAAQGTHDLLDGQAIDFYCGFTPGLALLGEPDRAHATWRIRQAHARSRGYALGSFVTIATAWYGLPSGPP